MITLTPTQRRVTLAKLQVRAWMPGFTRLLSKMGLVETSQVPTCAVDRFNRLYAKPEWVEQQTEGQLAYTMLHELAHISLNHWARFLKLAPEPTERERLAWNIATDLSIQHLCREYQEHEPEGIIRWDGHCPQTTATFVDLGLTPGQAPEVYYPVILEAMHQEDDNQGQGEDSQDDSEPGEDDSQGDAEPGEDGSQDGGEPGEDGEAGQDDGQGDGDQDGDGEGDAEPGEDGDGEGQGEGQEGDQGDGNPGQGDGEPGDSDDQSGSQGDGQPGSGQALDPAMSGSAADGQRKPWELDSSMEHAATIQAELAALDRELDGSPPGSLAGAIKQSLDVTLRPITDPWPRITRLVNRSVPAQNGEPYPTYAKRNRRQRRGKARMIGVEFDAPEATIIIDTSGSMMGLEGKAMDAIAKGLKRVDRPRVVAYDDAQQSAERIAKAKQFQFQGYGGTSMDRAVMEEDAEGRPDVIVVVTDGETAWPRKKTRAKLVVILVKKSWWVDENPPPTWAKTIDATVEQKRHAH